ncbi:5'-3' exoribonuclease [Vairimorpha necatrix]|uniref:5'-3' exoribonuclease n=1 Tax=Vairimorpha necatrix TaxID=6039 RepID=A0AAX4JAF9_9MICR
MGVPILFSWLNQKHPNCIRKSPPKHVDVVYIDLNALIHNCYNSNLRSLDEIYIDMLDRLKNAIDNIIEKTRPTKILYIAVDGVAPAAKLAHQRSRRYKAACEKIDNLEAEEEALNLEEELLACDVFKGNGFDSNAITPGTSLMEYLHNGINEMLLYCLSADPKYKNLKVIYSSYLVPGEGEQKIMAFLRKYHESHPSDTHLLYSPDGDIIFLGVGLYDVDLFIMREDTFNNPNKKVVCNICTKMGHTDYQCNKPSSLLYTYIDIPEFRSTLIKGFNLNRQYDKRRMLVDWVFICFLIGNDFLPGLPCVDIKISSIESLTNLLCKNFINCNEYLTTNDKMINFHVLENFFIALSNLEDSYYVVKTRMLNRFCDTGREEIPLQTKQGKMKYYASKLNAHNQTEIDNVSMEYITGMIWIYNYYINGRTNWDWVYPFHFAPFTSDLVKVVRARYHLKLGVPLCPFEQLMVVIPPQSKNLVPEKLHHIYEKFSQFYPVNIQSDMFDKYLSWTSVVLLPHLNSQLVLTEVKKILNEISAPELSKNAQESDLLYTSDKDSVINLQKLYFNLKPVTKYFLYKMVISVYPYYKAKYTGNELVFNNKKFTNKATIVRFDSLQ